MHASPPPGYSSVVFVASAHLLEPEVSLLAPVGPKSYKSVKAIPPGLDVSATAHDFSRYYNGSAPRAADAARYARARQGRCKQKTCKGGRKKEAYDLVRTTI